MKTIRRLQRRLAVCGNGKNSRLRYYSNYQPDYLHVTIEKQWNDRTVDLPFEDTVLMAPENWDQVLKQIYGDYMQLPPAKERVPTHSVIKIQVTG
jgi:lipopolysaccharide cholinephosphotransferase